MPKAALGSAITLCHHAIAGSGGFARGGLCRSVPTLLGCLKPQPRGVCPKLTQPCGPLHSMTKTHAQGWRTLPQPPAPYRAILGCR